MKKYIKVEIKNWEFKVFIIFLFFISLFYFSTSINNPIVFGDEGFHAGMAKWLSNNLEYPKYVPFEGTDLRKGAFFYPPNLHFLLSFFYSIFKSEIVFKISNPLALIFLSIANFLFISKIFNEKIALLSSIFLILIPSIATYAVLVYVDILFLLYITLFFFSFYFYLTEESKKFLILSSIFAFLAVSTKILGLIVFILIFLSLIFFKKNLRNFKNIIIIFLISFSLFSSFLLRNIFSYNNMFCGIPLIARLLNADCSLNLFEPKYSFSKRTAEIGTEQNVYRFGIINYLNFAYGPIFLLPLLFFIGLSFVYLKIKENLFFKYILLITIIFVLFFTLNPIIIRAEDTARWTLFYAPFFSLISSIYLYEILNLLKRYSNIVQIGLTLIIIYLLFSSFTSKLEIMASVKSFSPTFFEACEWVKNNLPKNATLFTFWAHRASYACERRATGNIPDISLSTNLTHILKVSKENGITHIFIQKFSIDLLNRNFSEAYNLDFVIFLEAMENFIKVYENGPSLIECIQEARCNGNIIYLINYTLEESSL